MVEFSAVLNKVRDYRWELWLFFGVPVTADLLALAIRVVFAPLEHLPSRWYYFSLDLPDIVAITGVLAVSYLRVRHLKSPLLRLLWHYSFVGLVTWTVSLLAITILVSPYERLAHIAFRTSLVTFLSIPIDTLISVWFARRASRGGFKYALVFLGILALPVIPAYSFWIWGGRYAVWTVLSVMLTLVAVWVLRRADSGGVINKGAIATLFSAALLSVVASYLVFPHTRFVLTQWSIFTGVVIAGLVAHYVVAVGLSYVMRAREIDVDFFKPEEPEPPPPEEPEEFVGLYRRRV